MFVNTIQGTASPSLLCSARLGFYPLFLTLTLTKKFTHFGHSDRFGFIKNVKRFFFFRLRTNPCDCLFFHHKQKRGLTSSPSATKTANLDKIHKTSDSLPFHLFQHHPLLSSSLYHILNKFLYNDTFRHYYFSPLQKQ